MLPIISGFPGIVGEAPVLPTFARVAGTSNTSDSTTKTFSSQSFGAAADDRILVAMIGLRQAGTSSTSGSCTIGGISATKLIDMVYSTDNRLIMFVASVPSGTSGSVVFTFPHTVHRCGYSLYRGTGLSATPKDTDNTSGTGTLSRTLTTTANSFVVGASWHVNTGAATWTGLTEGLDLEVESAARYSCAVSGIRSAGSLGLTVTYSGSNQRGIIAATFGEP